jgi:hypothetical protein
MFRGEIFKGSVCCAPPRYDRYAVREKCFSVMFIRGDSKLGRADGKPIVQPKSNLCPGGESFCGLGPMASEPVVCQWTNTASLVWSLVPWGCVIFLLLGVRANRHESAWWILLPLALIQAAVFGLFTLPLDMPAEAIDLLGSLVMAVAFGISVVWLFGHRLVQPRWWGTFGRFLATMGLAGILTGALTSPPSQFALFVAGFVVFSKAVVVSSLSLSLTLRRYGQPPTANRFLSLLALWLTVCWFAVFVVFFSISALFESLPPWDFMITAPFVFIGITYLILLPFVSLLFINNFYRERFRVGIHEPVSNAVICPGISQVNLA